MPILLELFLTFLKVGAVSFGGGYGMISLLSEEVVSKGWLTSSEFLDFIAVSESTPGPIAINMATFVGTSLYGFLGGLAATVGVVLPAFIIILLVASLISNLLKFAGVQGFLKGVRPVVVGLIIATGILITLSLLCGVSKIGDAFNFDYKSLIILALVCAFYFLYKKLFKKEVSVIILILFSALLGIVFYI